MALQFSVTVRNAMLEAIKTTIGSGIVFRLFGSVPANCAAADPGTALAEFSVSSPYFGTASGGSMSLSGTWRDPVANEDGFAAGFRIYESTGATCHIQGTLGTSGSGADLIVDTIETLASGGKFAPGEEVLINSFTITEGNA